MQRLAVLFNRLGPYHFARLEALAERVSVVAIELVRQGLAYDWDKVDRKTSFERITLFRNDCSDVFSPGVVVRRVEHALQRQRPSCVAVPGWSNACALGALRWCQRTNTPAVVMSESQRLDKRRTALTETVKKGTMRLFAAGLVGGSRHAAYLRELGMPPERIFTGYDVVDNQHFANGADAARGSGQDTRGRLGLPERFFLASSRFIAKKNLVGLLRAYALYRACTGAKAWKLVLLGDGQLRPQLLRQRKILGLESSVLLPGFQQVDLLPTYYGLASVFVHASTTEQWGLVVNEAMAAGLPVLVSNRCGCAPDLVEEGRNGYTFDPLDLQALARHMLKMSGGQYDLPRMGRASREIISRWTPKTFARNLRRAADKAMSEPTSRVSVLNRALLLFLMCRTRTKG